MPLTSPETGLKAYSMQRRAALRNERTCFWLASETAFVLSAAATSIIYARAAHRGHYAENRYKLITVSWCAFTFVRTRT